jgi:lipoate-protein ligase A
MIHEAGLGSWNMAVDEVLLERAGATGMSTLRIYTWEQPTLSLGYFQSHSDRQLHEPSRACAVVRRRSGGGAILHDHEITYALTVPVKHRWRGDAESLYGTVHEAICKMLERFGCTTRLYDGPRLDGDFLCFRRRTSGDLICGEHKIMGSAQRRTKAAILQHGSLLLRRSPGAPSRPGVMDLMDASVTIEELKSTMVHRILSALRLEPFSAKLSPSDRQRAATIDLERFSAKSWTLRR